MRRGLLVALEGGPGASTARQAGLLRRNLEAAGVPVHLVDPELSWVRAETVRAVEQRSYTGRVTPLLCRLARTVDIATRQIVPQMDNGLVVLVDRYGLTLVAHGRARGLDASWLDGLTAPLPPPALSVYLNVAPERQLRRLLEAGGSLEGWECGADLARAAGLAPAFRLYQARVAQAFEALCDRSAIEPLDGDADEQAVALSIRDRVLGALEAQA